MDAVTSFELEAQRRRETIALDRGVTRWRTEETAGLVEPSFAFVARRRAPQRLAPQSECRPAPATR